MKSTTERANQEAVTMSLHAELEADARPSGPLCPAPWCREPMVVYPNRLGLGPDISYDGQGWLCLNTMAHGGKLGTAAIWLDAELEAGPTTEAEWRELELVIPWPEGEL